jgi:hypothetical protein
LTGSFKIHQKRIQIKEVAAMNFLFKHGLRLTIPNLLGYLLSNLVVGIGYFLLFLIVAIGAGVSGGLEALSENDATFDSYGPVQLLTLLIGFLIFFFSVYVSNTVLVAGAFGSSVSAVYEEHSSINDYFNHVWRHFWKMTLLQLAWTVVLLPLFIPAFLISIVLDQSGSVAKVAGGLLLLLIFVLMLYLAGALYIYSPVLIIREGAGVWQSVKLSFRLGFGRIGQTLVTLLAVFAASLGITLIFGGLFAAFGLMAGFSFKNGIDGVGAAGIILLILLGLAFVFFVIPFIFALIHLIIVKRYKEKIKPILFPDDHASGQGNEAEPTFDLKGAH